MLKIIGMMILILSGCMGGYSATLRLSQKVRFIEEYMEFIKIIQNEVRYTGTYLSEIVKKYSHNGPFYSYLYKCYEYISNNKPFPSAWENTFINIQKELSISPELSHILNNFGLGLGSTDIDGQISHCTYNYELAIPYLEDAIEEKKSRGKLYGILGACLGIATALFFI